MLSSAVKLLGLALVAGGAEQQLDTGEAAAWRRIEPTIVRVMQGASFAGSAVLIDPQGLFLAHRSAAPGGIMFGRLHNGETIQLSVTGVDDVTQLALLKAEGWKPVNRQPAAIQAPESAYVQKASLQNATRVIVVLPDRTIRGELTTSTLVGVMAPSRRGLTLSEIRFEDPATASGGGLAFTLDGRLVGVLGATLDSPAVAAQRDSAAKLGTTLSGLTRGQGAPGAARVNFGPSAMTVAYSISPDILERVVAGFRSPKHQVSHPALGLMCRDAPGGGAYVESTVQGAAAQEGGIRPGDVIVEMAGTPIKNQVDYTRVLIRQEVGQTVQVAIRRGAETLVLPIKIGS